MMKLFDRILEKAAYSKKRPANEPAGKSSPARVRIMGVVKLAATVGTCMVLFTYVGLSLWLVVLPLFYSYRFIPEIYAGKAYSQTSADECGPPILLAVALTLVLGIFLFVWLSAESEKNPGFHGAIPQQSK